MDYLYVAGSFSREGAKGYLSRSTQENGGLVMCIGVKMYEDDNGYEQNRVYDLDNFLDATSDFFELVTRFPEVHNWNYPDNPEAHMLQPALLRYISEGPK